jgi:hypothetical protein
MRHLLKRFEVQTLQQPEVSPQEALQMLTEVLMTIARAPVGGLAPQDQEDIARAMEHFRHTVTREQLVATANALIKIASDNHCSASECFDIIGGNVACADIRNIQLSGDPVQSVPHSALPPPPKQ